MYKLDECAYYFKTNSAEDWLNGLLNIGKIRTIMLWPVSEERSVLTVQA